MSQPDWILVSAGGVIALSVSFLSAASHLGHHDSSARIAARMFLLRVTLAFVFTILGIVGSLLPILQGWIFFLLAFLMIFPESRFTEGVLHKAEPKLPRLVAWLRRIGIGKKAHVHH